MPFTKHRRSVLLVDFENLDYIYKRPFIDNIAKWLKWLESGEFDPNRVRRKFVARRVYWNTHHDIHRQVFIRHGFDVKLCRAIRKQKASSADFDITIDAIELAHQHPKMEEVIILSFDTDFSSVLLHLQLDGRTSVAMTDEDKLDRDTDTLTGIYLRILDHSIGKREFGDVIGVEFESGRTHPAALSVVVPATPQTSAAQSPPAPIPQTQAAATPPAQPAHAAATGASAFDFREAARRIAQSARDSGLVYVGKERVRNVMKNLTGFLTSGGKPWAGYSYERFLSEIVSAEPTQFEIGKTTNGGVMLTYRGTSAAN